MVIRNVANNRLYIGFIHDVQEFLRLVGRAMAEQHVSKFDAVGELGQPRHVHWLQHALVLLHSGTRHRIKPFGAHTATTSGIMVAHDHQLCKVTYNLAAFIRICPISYNIP
jgi:hypothetical protein